MMMADGKNAEILAALYNNAIDLINERDLSGAVEMLNQALELGGDNPQYSELLGLCLYARGSFEQARACWMRNAGLNSVSSNSGQYLKSMDSEEFSKYVQTFNSCIEEVEKSNYFKALLQLLPSLKFVPNVEGFNLAGLLFYKLGMRKSALRLWKKSLGIDLSDKTAAYYIANCRNGFMPFAFEKILREVLLLVGRFKLL